MFFSGDRIILLILEESFFYFAQKFIIIVIFESTKLNNTIMQKNTLFSIISYKIQFLHHHWLPILPIMKSLKLGCFSSIPPSTPTPSFLFLSTWWSAPMTFFLQGKLRIYYFPVPPSKLVFCLSLSLLWPGSIR